MGQGNRRSAFLLGGSGAVGTQVLGRLLAQEKFNMIHLPLRKESAVEHKKIKNYQFEKFFQVSNFNTPVTDFFYCFGSTLKQAGSKEEFRRLELSVAHQSLLVAKALQVKRFYLVSSQGADPHATFFYSRVKAEVEKIIRDHQFESLFIYRPALLVTKREHFRLGEAVAQNTLGLAHSILQKYFPASAPLRTEQLAQAIMVDVENYQTGHYIRENKNILELCVLSKEKD